MILGGLQVLDMLIIRDLARDAYLHDVFQLSQLENVNEMSPLIAFLLVFVIGLLSLVYMIRMMLKSKSTRS